MKKSKFEKHPSKLLNDLYSKRNYQGADPFSAKILFVGRDPNWEIDIENEDMFKFITEYLTDGVHFWKKYKIHHPFLRSEYKGDGKQYHRKFSYLKLDSNSSNEISFIELIGFPTIGMAKKNRKIYFDYLISEENRRHLIEIDDLLNDLNKTIFIAWGLLDDFKFLNRKKIGLFKKFAGFNKSVMDRNDLNQIQNIFIHPHFSNAISNATLGKMSMKIQQVLLKDSK